MTVRFTVRWKLSAQACCSVLPLRYAFPSYYDQGQVQYCGYCLSDSSSSCILRPAGPDFGHVVPTPRQTVRGTPNVSSLLGIRGLLSSELLFVVLVS